MLVLKLQPRTIALSLAYLVHLNNHLTQKKCVVLETYNTFKLLTKIEQTSCTKLSDFEAFAPVKAKTLLAT